MQKITEKKYHMNKKLFLIAMALTFNVAVSMEEGITRQLATIIITDDQEEQITTRPVVCFDHNFVGYIGQCEERTKAEEFFGKQLPLNTVFFQVDYKNRKYLGLKRFGILEFIPYEYIKDKKEGDYIELSLDGKNYPFLCLQQASDSYNQYAFEVIVQTQYQRFLKCANWLCAGDQVLFEGHVVERSLTQHGKNGTPDAKK